MLYTYQKKVQYVEQTISLYVNQAKEKLNQLKLSEDNKLYLWDFLFQFIDRIQ